MEQHCTNQTLPEESQRHMRVPRFRTARYYEMYDSALSTRASTALFLRCAHILRYLLIKLSTLNPVEFDALEPCI